MSETPHAEVLSDAQLDALGAIYADVRDPNTQVMVVPRLLATLAAAQADRARLERLVSAHHDVGAMAKLEWGRFCPVCPLPDWLATAQGSAHDDGLTMEGQ